MSEKRRDSKGRILRNGECQRKDGLYQYDYVDLNGKSKCLYSWKLEATVSHCGKRKERFRGILMTGLFRTEGSLLFWNW